MVVFLGPSLAREEAKALVRCRLLPPARQGDVWKALAYRPRVLVLIDGVFELQPSVWHRELLATIDAGVTVFGASSMGALRAAEFDSHGMVGIGKVYDRVKPHGLTVSVSLPRLGKRPGLGRRVSAGDDSLLLSFLYARLRCE